MKEVFIAMDDTWQWRLVTQNENPDQVMTLEIDQVLFDEYQTAHTAYREVQEKLEQLYRVQEQLKPSTTSVPHHVIISKLAKGFL